MIPIWWRYFDSLTALLQILWYIGSYKVSDLAEQFKIRGHRSIEAASVAGQQPVFLSAEAGFQLFPFVARMMSNGTCTWNKRLQVRSFQIFLLGRRDWAAPGQWLFFATGFCSQLNLNDKKLLWIVKSRFRRQHQALGPAPYLSNFGKLLDVWLAKVWAPFVLEQLSWCLARSIVQTGW